MILACDGCSVIFIGQKGSDMSVDRGVEGRKRCTGPAEGIHKYVKELSVFCGHENPPGGGCLVFGLSDWNGFHVSSD